MTASITRCCRKWLEPLLAALLFACAASAHAGSIDVVAAAIKPGDDGAVLAAEFSVDLGARLEDVVARGVPLYFNLELTVERTRWYWLNEQVASVNIHYRLAYHSLTRQYRLSIGGFHQNFTSLAEALRAMSRVASLHVADKGVLRAGEAYAAAVRLSLDRSQLPKPFQVDALVNRDWNVDAKTLRWQYVHSDAAPAAVRAAPTAPAVPAAPAGTVAEPAPR